MTNFTRLSNLNFKDFDCGRWILIGILPAVFLSLYLYLVQNELRYAFPRDYAEGTTLAYVEKWRSPEIGPRNIYSENAFEVGDITGYPFFHVGILRYTSAGSSSAMVVGRLLSFISLLLLIGTTWQLINLYQPLEKKYLPLFATFFIAQSAILDWSVLARSDIFAATLEALGIYTYFKESDKKYLRYLNSGLYFVLAFYSKQNYVVGPLVIGLYELRHHYKSLAKSIPIYSLFYAASILGLTALFGSSYWNHTVFQLQDSPIYWTRFAGYTFSYFIPHIVILALAILFFLAKTFPPKLRFILCSYFGISITLALLGIGRIGSNFNYFINAGIPLAMMAFLGLYWLSQIKSDKKIALSLTVFLLFLILIGENFTHLTRYPYPFMHHRDFPATQQFSRSELTNYRQMLQNFNKDKLFCDDPGLCTLFGIHPSYYFFETQLSSKPGHKLQKINGIAQKILNQEYEALILTDYPSKKLGWAYIKYSDPIIEAIQEKYQLAIMHGLIYVYTPKIQPLKNDSVAPQSR